MSLESTTTIAGLVATNPTGSDTKDKGDDHLRLIKAVLQATFPALAGVFNKIQVKTSGYTVVAADNYNVFVVNSGASFTLALTAAATLGNGFTFAVINLTDTTDVTIDPNAAELVNSAATVLIPPRTCSLVFCDGTGFYTIQANQQASLNPKYHTPLSVGIDCKNNAGTPNTQFDIAAAYVQLQRISVNTAHARAVSATNNISTAGPAANGRDQAGAFSASTWVHFYIISDPSGNTVATLSSATAPPTGPTLPTGYTHWAYVGAVFIDGSSNLKKVHIKGSKAFYLPQQLVLNAGTAASMTAVSVANFTPPNSLSYSLFGFVSAVTDAANGGTYDPQLDISPDGTLPASCFWSLFLAGLGNPVNINSSISEMELPNVSQQFFYKITASLATSEAASLYLRSYKIPNGSA